MESLLQQEATSREQLQDRYLIIWIENQLFGVPIENVLQIVQMQEIIKIPQAPHYEKGVIHLRGNIIPVLDVRLRLGKEEAPYTERTCILVCSVMGKTLGLIVDAVEEVVKIGKEDISAPPEMDAHQASFLQGVARSHERMILLLSVGRLWGYEE